MSMIVGTNHSGLGAEKRKSYMHCTTLSTIVKTTMSKWGKRGEGEKKKEENVAPESGGKVGKKLGILMVGNVHWWRLFYIVWFILKQFCNHSV